MNRRSGLTCLAIIVAVVLTATSSASADKSTSVGDSQAAPARSPAPAADGDWIVYSDAYGIRLIRPDGSDRHYILNQPGARSPRWSPDGQRIAYHVTEDDQHRAYDDPNVAVWVMNADGSGRRAIAHGFSPQWMPSSDELFVVRHNTPDQDGFGEIFTAHIVDLADGSERRLPLDTSEAVSAPTLSPDGSRVAFQWRDDEQYPPTSTGPAKEFVTVDLDGSARQEHLAQRRIQSSRPLGWMNDGRVLYSCEPDDSSGADWAATCAVDVATGTEALLTGHLDYVDVYARGTPSGARILVGGFTYLYVVDRSGALLAQVHRGGASYFAEGADWRPRPLPPFTEDHADVLRLYRAFFDREPDRPGAIYWIDTYEQGATKVVIAESFTHSAEFRGAYDGTTNREYVRRVYLNVLDREPDQKGYDYWLERLDNGALTRATLVLNVAANNEFINKHSYTGIPR